MEHASAAGKDPQRHCAPAVAKSFSDSISKTTLQRRARQPLQGSSAVKRGDFVPEEQAQSRCGKYVRHEEKVRAQRKGRRIFPSLKPPAVLYLNQ